MGDGVRELDEDSDGAGVMEPSSDPLIENVSGSDSSGSTTARRDERVLCVGVEACCSAAAAAAAAAAARRAGIFGCDGAATRCLGASGGLFSLASGWNSMMGRSKCSQLYCWHSEIPRSKGIHVPKCAKLFTCTSPGLVFHTPWYLPYPPWTFSCSPFCTSRSNIRVRCGLSNPATLRIWVALSQESARRLITATPLHIL